MNLSLTRVAGTAALSVAVLVGLTVPAHAESETIRDKRRDVQTVVLGEDPGAEPTIEAAPGVADPDIVRTRISHTRNRLVVQMKLRKIKARPHFQAISVRTNQSRYEITSSIGAGLDKGVEITRARGREVECEGAEVTLDRRKGLITTAVPRSCLADPRWVRVGAAVMTMNWAFDVWLDEARGDSININQEQLPLGPRLRRG